MRRRGFRVFVIIAVIVALSIATLSSGDIHIGSLDRANSGPLGLKLGLDLQGGSHLKYQADLPDEVRVTFQEAVEEGELRSLLDDELKQTRATIAKREYTIGELALAERAQGELREIIEDLSPIETFNIEDDVLEITFQGGLSEVSLRAVLDELGYTEATIVPPTDEPAEGEAERMYTVQGLTLEERAQEEVRVSLEEGVASIEAYDTGDGVLNVTFRSPVGEAELRPVLSRLGYVEATLESPAQNRYTIQQLFVDEVAQGELRRAFERELAPIEPGALVFSIIEPDAEDIAGVVEIIQRRINALGTTEPVIQALGNDRVVVQLPGFGGSSIDVAFQPTPGAADLSAILGLIGRTGDGVEASGLNSYIIRTEEPLSLEDEDALREILTEIMGRLVAFEVREDENEVAVAFPSQPTEVTLSSLMAELGFTDFTVRVSDVGEYRIRTDKALTTEELDRLREALEIESTRVVAFEVKGGIEEAKQLIGQTAQLVFKERECLASPEEIQASFTARSPDPCDPVEAGGGGRFVDTLIGQTQANPDGLTGKFLNRAFRDRDPISSEPLVQLEFNGQGTDMLRAVIPRLFDLGQLGRLAIFLDDRQVSAAVVRSPEVFIDGRGVIQGGFTNESARTLAIQLESGRLPVPLAIISESTVDALLGADSLRKSLIAGLVGLGLVLLFMMAYYRMAGVVAGTALLVYAAILLAIFKLIPVTLTLSGIAGLVLSVGIAVDANILIFERMKEEMRTGRTLTSSMEMGFRRAWPAIRDSNVSTIITCIILWWFGDRLGAPLVTGFALTLLIGVMVSMFTAIMVSRNMLQILALTPIGKRISLFTPEPRRQPVGAAGSPNRPS